MGLIQETPQEFFHPTLQEKNAEDDTVRLDGSV